MWEGGALHIVGKGWDLSQSEFNQCLSWCPFSSHTALFPDRLWLRTCTSPHCHISGSAGYQCPVELRNHASYNSCQGCMRTQGECISVPSCPNGHEERKREESVLYFYCKVVVFSALFQKTPISALWKLEYPPTKISAATPSNLLTEYMIINYVFYVFCHVCKL